MTDWQTITTKLRAQHGSLSAAGRIIGVDPDTLRKLDRGDLREPRYSEGVILVGLRIDRPYLRCRTYGEVLGNFGGVG